MSMPAMVLSISPARCDALPTPARAVAQLAGIGLGVGDEFLERMRRHRRVHHQGIGADRHVDDRREVLGDVVRRRLMDDHRERQAARRVQQRIAVRRGVRSPALLPMMPAAPGRFSTTKVWCKRSPSFCASIRAITSTPPPAATGTMICTGLSGYSARAKPTEPMTIAMIS